MESSRCFAQVMGEIQGTDGAKGVRRIMQVYAQWRMAGRWLVELVSMNFPRCTRSGKRQWYSDGVETILE